MSGIGRSSRLVREREGDGSVRERYCGGRRCDGTDLLSKLAESVDPDNPDAGENSEWEEVERYSFEDSDRFEEDSLCSWSTEPESLCNNWRGWKKPAATVNYVNFKKSLDARQTVSTLTELAAKCVAAHIPFELVEKYYPPVPEQLQLRIAFWSFPDNEEDIRLYSCLANGAAEEFLRGENLYKNEMVKNTLQIGFHLSATVQQTPRGSHNVAVTFDRGRISSCNCTCNSTAYWCSHIVAVCLTRIHMPEQATLRAPVSESLSRLRREQLQKFAQYLISELPQQILPTAQRILDELLGGQSSGINSVCGAPDPTAGASVNDQTAWYLDEKTLHENIKKILIKFCIPAPIVFSDVNYLGTVAPPAASEWTSLLRPLRGREPEGMWNLLSIVREMFKRNDRNAVPLLEIITEECLACEQIVLWWFNTRVALLTGNSGYAGGSSGKHNNVNSNTNASQHACSSLCDEVAALWRLAALNPALAPHERDMFHSQFSTWHLKIIEKVKSRNAVLVAQSNTNKSINLKNDLEVFTGFKPAIEACYLDWDDYPIPGITYTQEDNPMYHCSFTCFRHAADKRGETVLPQVNTSKLVLRCNHQHPSTSSCQQYQYQSKHHHHSRVTRINYLNAMSLNPIEFPPRPQLKERNDGNRSSVSSEGFCENDDELGLREADSDSQEGAGSDSSSSEASHNTKKNRNKGKNTVKSENSRRSSKDESTTSSSNSESPNSSDDYNVYYYNPKDLYKVDENKSKVSDSVEIKPSTSKIIRNLEDEWEVLFSRAEGLHAHGHSKEACVLSVKLARELLANPPQLILDIPPAPKRKCKKPQVNPTSHQMSCVASATLAKCAFLCSVLAEYSEHSHLAFRVAMFGLELARPPASTKPLEVKLANQETDLVHLLRRIPLGPREVDVVRERAELLQQGTTKLRGEAILPIMLANFVFEALVLLNVAGRERIRAMALRRPSDEILGFEAAVATLGMKSNVSEADHPLLCEGTRRQRGDLAVALLTFYKDDSHKVARIMDKLLDREVHQLLKSPVVSTYYTSNPPFKSHFSSLKRDDSERSLPSLSSIVQQTDKINNCEIGTSNSRPQSSPSAEHDNIVHHSLSQTCHLMNPSSMNPSGQRLKERFKGKRAFPSIPNQPSEASAHFMFELAKTVLIKAGGNSSTSLFTQASNGIAHGPHRALHMCAFQLGLYALGLHNYVSPNWLSRTYSSHVSWITGQATEIGTPAISFLIDTWEGHLTPPEAVSIADRASRGCDKNLVQAAAELALSCLPYSHALNPNEIQRAIAQCKEQSEEMLEHACLTVESAAKGGGVYPEVLFQVAKHWYELYVRHTPGAEHLLENESSQDLLMDPHVPNVAFIEPTPDVQQMPPGLPPPTGAPVLTTNGQVVVTTAPPPPYQHPPPTTLAPIGVTIPYAVAPYNFIHPHHVSYGGPIHSHAVSLHQGPPPTHIPMYQFQYPPPPVSGQQFTTPPPTYTNLPPPPNAPGGAPQPNGFSVATSAPGQYTLTGPPPPPPSQTGYIPNQTPTYAAIAAVPPPSASNQIQYYGTMTIAPSGMRTAPLTAGHIYPVPLTTNSGAAGGNGTPPGVVPQPSTSRCTQTHRPQQFNQTQWRYLLMAYRVGMLALETLTRRVHDDRPQTKYARNPPYGEDVKWLMRLSRHLGTQYLHHFCVCVVNSIVSPFVLHDVAFEAAQYLSRNNPGLVMQHLRTSLLPLVQKCQQMYIQCLHQKLYHLTPADYEDFINIVCMARAAFHITPDGSTHFKEWLQSIKKTKTCKKELWTQINAAVQTNSK